MNNRAIRLRIADTIDLPALNRVVEAAVMTWQLPERVRRLALPSYRYNELDLKHLTIELAENEAGDVIGVAAWEEADPRDVPDGQKGLLLHGIYVDPVTQRRGVGRQLFQAAEKAARSGGYAGLLVKAQEDANGFFHAMGMTPLAAEDAKRHYANRFWLRLT